MYKIPKVIKKVIDSIRTTLKTLFLVKKSNKTQIKRNKNCAIKSLLPCVHE